MLQGAICISALNESKVNSGMGKRAILLQGKIEIQSKPMQAQRYLLSFLIRTTRVTRKETILIIDDHPLFREGLKAIIRRNNRFRLIEEAGNGREGLRMARELKPDLALVDMSLPDQSGIQLTCEIKNKLPKTHIIIITMHSKVDYIVKAFQAGATGYVVKESTSERLLQGMDAVLKGEYFMDSSVSHIVVEKLMQFPEKEVLHGNPSKRNMLIAPKDIYERTNASLMEKTEFQMF
ncbi:MAG: hypothetical protein SRB2_04525 [Desulfobacteraceae bacterium Eth-SRB2]|nr:MAG: hypothetical protein SRB2_04525 [Desulfobacteraceae bacterium Eth-SRB2]